MFNRPCNCNRQPMGGGMQPIVEPTITSCVQKDFFCEVPHVCPIHTHTVNKVHYNHVYTPKFSCSESTEIINNDSGNCCNFVNR